MSDLQRLAVDLARGAVHVLDQAETITRKSSADVEATSKALAPVDTGFLRSSIGSDIRRGADFVEGEIGPTAAYGAYVEFGTARQAPQAYMGPALDRHSSDFEAALRQITDQLL